MKRMPKLTPRQHAFLDKLVELYRERREPVHYSDLAERVGVNRFSAYDMLKVLEKKGMAFSTYALAAPHAGPGRSLVVFSPTEQAASLALGLQAANGLGEEWTGVRARLLGKLRDARDANYREILDDLLAHLPEAKAPLIYCAEMVGVLLLNMRRTRARVGDLSPFRVLAALRGSGDAGLETLAGLSVGTSLVAADDEPRAHLTQRLVGQARHYQAALSRLSEDARSALSQFLEEALEALE